MHCFLALLSFLLPYVSARPVDSHISHTASRVVNGHPVTDNAEYPFVIDLSFHPIAISSSRFCTATLIAPTIVLTAAHCVLNDGYKSAVYATIGRIQLDDHHKDNHKAQTFRTIASVVHPEYQGLASPNDVALMLLNASSDAPTVRLADRSPATDDVAWVVGYGVQMLGTVETSSRPVEIMSGRLQKTALRIKQRQFCNNPEMGIETAEGMLCTAGVHRGSSACKGDSGGGLFLKNNNTSGTTRVPASDNVVQIGIVSYGDARCSSEESGVFTDIAKVRPWIQTSMERLQQVFDPAKVRQLNNTNRGIAYPTPANGSVTKLYAHLKSMVKYYNLHNNSRHNKSGADTRVLKQTP